MQSLLDAVELCLARWVVIDMALPVAQFDAIAETSAWQGRDEELSGAAIDGEVDRSLHERLWAEWQGREEAFYIRCAERVDGLAWRQVVALGGGELVDLERKVRQAHHRLVDPKLPQFLRPGTYKLVRRHDGRSLVDTYRGYDPVELPDDLLYLLPVFDGRPTDRVIDELRSQKGIVLEDDLIRKLIDFDVLVARE